ncbi:MAG: hypothetical protein AAF674_17970 [Pseudomonadota bacterium]
MPFLTQISNVRLAETVDRAYTVFRLPRPADLAVDKPYGIPPETETRMLAQGQRDISLDDLRIWHHPHFSPDSAQDAVRWVLPKNLECLSAGHWIYHAGNSIALIRLTETGFPNAYKPAEQELMKEFALRLTTAFLEAPAHYEAAFNGVDEILCMFALGGLDLGPVLSHLASHPTEQLVQALAPGGHVTALGRDPFWESGKQLDVADAWYTSNAMELRLIDLALNESAPGPVRAHAEMIADDIRARRR